MKFRRSGTLTTQSVCKSLEALDQTLELFALPLDPLRKPLKMFIQVIPSVEKSHSNFPCGRLKHHKKSLEFYSKMF